MSSFILLLLFTADNRRCNVPLLHIPGGGQGKQEGAARGPRGASQTPGTARTASARRATSGSSSRRRASPGPQHPPRTRASHTPRSTWKEIRAAEGEEGAGEGGDGEVTPGGCACAGRSGFTELWDGAGGPRKKAASGARGVASPVLRVNAARDQARVFKPAA